MNPQITFNFRNGAFIELSGNTSDLYVIEFIDKSNNQVIYTETIMSNHWTKTNRTYYTDWLIKISTIDGNLLFENSINLEGQKVLISLTSNSLGDTISWVPYCEEFRKKHNCKLMVQTNLHDLFTESYPEITWLKPNTFLLDNEMFYATYKISVGIDDINHKLGIKKLTNYYNRKIPIKFIDGETFFNINEHKEHPTLIPIQKIATNYLGLEFNEIRPKLPIISLERPIKEKYICISEFASANGMKIWQNKIGWKTIVDYLKSLGYEVISISKEKTNLNNVIKRNGNYSLQDRIWYLQHCEFFIGMSSGLSWLAWASQAKVVMISGHSKKWFEFSDCIRINNENVCNGCHNIPEHTDKFCCFHESFCPENKNFICTRAISPKMVLDRIKESNLI